MEEKRTSLEVIAPSIEEAIAEGLEDLGLPEEAVDIEILDIGSQGLFGIGSRHARIRMTIKDPDMQKAALESEQESSAEDESDSQQVSQEGVLEEEETIIKEVEQPVSEEIEETSSDAPADLLETESETPEGVPAVLNEEVVLHVAQVTVEELLEKMGIEASVEAYHGEPDDERSRTPLIVDINGDDLSILIGPRAETLNALQYITNLIIGKELGRSVPLIVDVEGFRKRRNQQLRRLAQQMADQAVNSGRRQVLEPMPANERRIVHIELRGNPDVTTESIGDDPRRKVTIIPVEGDPEQED